LREGGTPYNGLYWDAPPERGTLGSRHKKGIPFSGWRYVKGVPFQGKRCERGNFSRWRYVKGVPFQGKVCERVPIFEI